MNFADTLIDFQDLKYKDFHSKLIPTISSDKIIGVRTPVIRKIAKQHFNSDFCTEFLNTLPHKYYEENNLHAFFIEQIKDFDICINEVERFLAYIDNWATCDSLRPKCFSKNTDKLLPYIKKWIKSNHTYTVRFSIETLLVFYLDDKFKKEYLKIVSSIKTEEYYINMMIAWYFATALCKQWKYAIPYIEQYKMPRWVHNKTIQKSLESYRISEDKKEYLRTFIIKK